jgi:hypothetical protein
VRESETECDSEPEVPLTDTVETLHFDPDPDDEPPPPHAVRPIRDKVHASRIGRPILRRRIHKLSKRAGSAVSLKGRVTVLTSVGAITY